MAQNRKTSNKTVKKTQKRSKSSKSSLKKGKVHIPAYKIIILCTVIITLCMALLLVTTIADSGKKIAPNELSQRFEKTVPAEKPAADKSSEKPVAAKPVQKSENKQTKPAAKTETKPQTQVQSPAASQPKPQQKPQSQPQTQNQTKTQSSAVSKTQDKTQTQTQVQPQVKPQPVTQSKSQTQNQVQQKPAETQKTTQPASTSQPVDSKPAINTSSFNFPAAKAGAQLVIIFDDGGQNLSQLEKCVTLPFPVTVAVLPQLAHSKEAADRVRKSGNEVILHQPMQSINNSVNPGPGAITPDMSENQIISTLFTNINQIGPITGINNHEGSAITADAEKMAVIMKTTSEAGLYFLDSRTNVETKVPYVAKEMGYTYYERNVFLDNEKTRENILKELKKGIDIANKTGVAIMIGHVWSADILPGVLKEVYPELKSKGYSFVTVSNCKGKKGF